MEANNINKARKIAEIEYQAKDNIKIKKSKEKIHGIFKAVFVVLQWLAWAGVIINSVLLFFIGPMFWIYDDGLGAFLGTFYYPFMGIIYLLANIFFLKRASKRSNIIIFIGVIMFSVIFISMNILVLQDILIQGRIR